MEPFTYQSLGTLTGAVTATVLTVELCKLIWPKQGVPTRLLVLVIAEGIVLITNIASSAFALKNMPLYFFNGLLVASSAMGVGRLSTTLSSAGLMAAPKPARRLR